MEKKLTWFWLLPAVYNFVTCQWTEPFLRSVALQVGEGVTLHINSPTLPKYIQLYKVTGVRDAGNDGTLKFDSRTFTDTSAFKYYERGDSSYLSIKSATRSLAGCYYISTDILEKYYFNFVVAKNISIMTSKSDDSDSTRFECSLEWYGSGTDDQKYEIPLSPHEVPKMQMYLDSKEINSVKTTYTDDYDPLHHILTSILDSPRKDINCTANSYLLLKPISKMLIFTSQHHDSDSNK